MITHYNIRNIVENICKTDIISKNYYSVRCRKIYVKLCKDYLKTNNKIIGDTIGFNRFTIRLKDFNERDELYLRCKNVLDDTISGIEFERWKYNILLREKIKELEEEYDFKLKKLTNNIKEFEDILSLPSDLLNTFINTRINPYLKFHKK